MVPEALSKSITEIRRDLDARRTSSRELAELVITAVDAWQPHINAFLSFSPDELRDQADWSDRLRARDRIRGPLEGIPLGYKDMFDRIGQSGSAGTVLLDDRVPEADATVIARLESSGAILAGRLNMAECVASPSGHNPHFGAVANPWNHEYTAAGSSGGSGAAVAARLVFGALGSDTGGSIRLPASVNGVVGLKPTYGRVSRKGAAPRAPSLDVVGPLARTAEDCALLLDCIAGTDPRDPTTWAAPGHDALPLIGTDLVGLRVATSNTPPFDSCDCDVAAAHKTAIRVIERCTGAVTTCDLPKPDLLYALADVVSKVEAAALHSKWMRDRPDDYSAFVFKRTEVGFHIPAQRYFEACALRGRILKEFMGAVFSKLDVLILPVMPIAVPKLAETAAETPEAIRRVLGRMTALTRPFNYLGLPSVSVPCGFDGHGMPVAFQLIGPPFSEPLLLALAHAYQCRTDWHRRCPPQLA